VNSNRPRVGFLRAVGYLALIIANTYSLAAQNASQQSIETCPPGPCYAASTTPPLQTTSPAVTEPAVVDPILRLSVTPHHFESLNAADLRAFPHKTITYHNAHTNADETYSGVPLTDLLAKYGVPTGDKLHGKPLSDYIVATGSDGYKAVIALAETDPTFHPGDILVADTMGGRPIDPKDGPFRLIVSEDKRPARCVHNLVLIELRSAE
jgi:hypothetical protein